MKTNPERIKAQFESLRARLAQVEWMSQGYVQNRGPGAGGPCYQWTRKEKGKTISVALSKEQYEAMSKAIENWRELEELLDQMQALSRQYIFGTLTDIRRRKPLTNKVLGLK